MSRKILVTGAAGYIGSVLVRQLLSRGYSVIGMDILNFGGESLVGVYNNPRFSFFKGDVRNEKDAKEGLKGVDAVVHLAAIVGDPACSKQPDLAKETNWESSKLLFNLAVEEKTVKNFVFASTCSNYGKMVGDGVVDEKSPLSPVSLYAELKVKFEKYILDSNTRTDFVPTSLRFATVYGISPRMRFDLTVNEFMREVAFDHKLRIFGEQFWRPYTHVEDLAASCILVLESDKQKIVREVFNVGDTNENYQKKMIAEEILKLVPSARISYVHKEEDPRDYRVNFSKIKESLGFRVTKTVPQGLKEIHSILQNGLLSDPFSSKYKNI